jgi:hypothetical protein
VLNGDLQDVVEDHLKRSEDVGLARADVLHGYSVEHVARNAQHDDAHDAHDRNGAFRVVFKIVLAGVDEAAERDDEAAHAEPEHEDGGVDVLQLAGNDGDDGAHHGNHKGDGVGDKVEALIANPLVVAVALGAGVDTTSDILCRNVCPKYEWRSEKRKRLCLGSFLIVRFARRKYIFSLSFFILSSRCLTWRS